MSPAAPPLEDDNLLSEILLRLPPQPSSLPRASAVCKRWRSLASDPAFFGRFRRHHRNNAPLLGFFDETIEGISFVPTLEVPNRVPPGRFSLQLDDEIQFFGCRHGLILIFDYKALKFLVWDPVTGQQHHLDIPPLFDLKNQYDGTVLPSAAGDVQNFKVVLVSIPKTNGELNRPLLAWVYSSETRAWGNVISTPSPSSEGGWVCTKPAVLVGDSLYWALVGSSSNILEFDLEMQRLAVIEMPISVGAHWTVMRAEGGGLGLLSVSGLTAQLWKWKTDSHGVSSWGMGTTIELDKLLSLNPDSVQYLMLLGFAEDNNSVSLFTNGGIFTIQLEPLQFKKRSKPKMLHQCHPFESVYAAGI